jgi:CMP/dCMP kinase
MSEEKPLVITISRQLGSGGAYIGQKLAEKLHLQYLDREIIIRTAKKLDISVKDLEIYDEQVTPQWQSALVASSFTSSSPIFTYPILPQNDRVIFAAEAEVINNAIEHAGAVIVGRGGAFILRNYPSHISIYLHADIDFRVQRIIQTRQISSEDAKKLIETIDRTRAKYMKSLTGQDWMQVWMYHLAVDTGIIGLEKAEKLILQYIKTRYPEINITN